MPLVRAALPGANCGGCGLPGCDALASNIVDGTAAIDACPVGGADCAAAIAEIMGMEAGSAVKKSRLRLFVREPAKQHQTGLNTI